MPTESLTSPNSVDRGTHLRPASPRARKAARERGVDLASVEGSGPGGRIVEADVLRFLEESKRRVEAAEPERLRVTPAARRLARELGVPLGGITGTGPGGRITREDVLAAMPPEEPEPRPAEAPVPAAEVPAAVEARPVQAAEGPALGPNLTGRMVPLSRKRRVTAQKMSLSARTVARITLTLEADMSEAVRVRQELLPTYESQYGVRLSYNDLLILVLARALREHPHLNARWTDEGIALIDQVNVGLAMAVSDGLIVPVVKGADGKTLAQIARATTELLARAREDRLGLEEITDGTFTLTNLGMYGIEVFTPIVNPPEVAILGVGKIVDKPVAVEGQVVVRPRMSLSLSVDHRVVDGAPAAEFLARVQQLLEKPYLLL